MEEASEMTVAENATMAPGQEELRNLAKRMKELQDDIELRESVVKELKEQFDELRLKKIPEKMEALGVKNITFVGIGRVQTAQDIYAGTREGQKEAGIQWLRDCGHDGMVTENYNSSSLKALFRRMIKDGAPIPDDIFSVTPFTRASIVRK